jgi:hypothetical protein
MKSVTRILIGLAMFYPAYRMHVAAHNLVDKAIGTDWCEQPHDPTDFFGPDPREEIERPENKKMLAEAIEMDQRAVMVAGIGGLFILWGVYPVLRVPLRWLLMPEWLKQRIEAQEESTAESNEVEHGKPEAEKRKGMDAGMGDSGNLPIAPAPGGSERRGAGNIQGGGVGA